MHRPPKVRDLDFPPRVDQQVLGLDVTVDHILVVAIEERRGQRPNVIRRSLLGEPPQFLQILIHKREEHGEFSQRAASNACAFYAGTSTACVVESLHSHTGLYLIELPTRRELKDEVYSRLVIEIAVETQNVFVSQMRLNFNLAPQLVLHSGLSKLRFEQDLESYNVMTFFLTSQIHIAKLSTPERFADIKVC